MKFCKDFFKSAIVILLKVYKSFLLNFDGKLFAVFFNLKSILILSPSRLSWDGQKFIVRDKNVSGFEYRFRHQRQGNMAYEFGIEKRTTSLAKNYFLEDIKFESEDIFIDCGANVGDLKAWFDLKGYNIKYIGFEPSPVEFGCLKENVQPSEVHNVGLWKDSGDLEFFVSSQGADSSLIEPANFDTIIKVPVEKLENYVNSKVKLLKLEAEGAEPEILEGLGEKLHLVEYISADLGFERGVNSESTLIPVTNFLLDRGFELVNLSHGRICALYKNKNM